MRHSSIKNTKNLLPTPTKKHTNLSFLLCASAAFVLLQASNAHANPSGANVVAGGISINAPSAGKLLVNQSTDKAIINWKNFNIANGESTQFVQPSANSVTLNRITDGNPTQILGNLSANGKLMVVNPNGVFFGENSRVDVAGMIASTADTTNSDFLAGKTNLSIAGKADASIVNKGHITATDSGLVALVAPSVRNDGVIQANMGTVALASTQTASVDFYGDNLYSFALDKETTAAAQNEKSAVTNSGIISVGSGKVLLTAKVAKGVVDNVINNTGIIEAVSSHMEGGTVVLDGGDGNVNLSGTINATGITGGKVTVTGENIILAAADINASGKNGGGTVKIGGDYQGKGKTPHAKTVKIDTNSKINVSATDSGNGGISVVWSDESTSFSGSILGTGGVNGGNGGLAEVSSKGKLGYNGSADLHAFSGEAGTLLLDPGNLTLANAGFVPLAGDFFVDVSSIITTLNGGTNSIQIATNDLNVINNIIWGGTGSLTLTAGNNINLTNSAIGAASGNITTNSIAMNLTNSSIKSTLGDVTINNTGKFYSNLANVLEGHSVKLNQNTAGNIQNAIDAVGTTGAGGATLQLGNGTWSELVNINQGNFTLKGNGSANTHINAPSALSTIISVGAGNDNVTISDLSVAGGRTGISASNNSNFVLNNSQASGAGHNGLLLDTTNNASVTNNTFNNNNVGVYVNKSTSTKIDNNKFHNNKFSINSINSIYSKITNNELYNELIGMSFSGDTYLTINNNYLHNDQTGIILVKVADAQITENRFDYINLGIAVSGGRSITIDNNTLDHINYGVIAGDSTKDIRVTNNTLTGYNNTHESEDTPGSYAIHIVDGINSVVVDNNSVDNFVMGIGIETSANTNINENFITNTVKDAIFLNKNNNTFASDNVIDNATRGIHVISSTGDTTLNGNDIKNTSYGVVVENTNNINLNHNKLTNNGIGVSFYDSNNATLAGDVFTGGDTGVLLNGASSSMQFSGNTSEFTGQNYYFKLENDAMFAGGSLAQIDSLDASQQTFDGTRASDFTVAQRDAAEAKTIDVEDGTPTIGNVFYKNFGTPPLNINGLIPTQEFPFYAGLFSYAGRTINNDPGVTPPTFSVPALNLSLLNPAAGGVNPAGLTPRQLGGLEPAAGGDNAQTLASLEPAAGSDDNCGNNFLGSGFNNDFDHASCSLKQQQ